MIIKALISFICILFSLIGVSQVSDFDTLIITGYYNHKTILVHNPLTEIGFGYSIESVTLNDFKSTSSIDQEIIEVDLTCLGLKKDDSVLAEIIFSGDVIPYLINPEVLRLDAEIEINDFKLKDDQHISFKATANIARAEVMLERYYWNAWRKVGEFYITEDSLQEYNFEIVEIHGVNSFRLKQYLPQGDTVLNQVKFVSKYTETEIIDYYNILTLNLPTYYAVFDTHGRLISKGFGAEPNIIYFDKGIYYICSGDKIGTPYFKNSSPVEEDVLEHKPD